MMRFKHFSLSEFNCTCGCHTGCINPLLVALLDKVRTELKAAISVTSGIRCPQKNAAIKGHPKSRHIPDQVGVTHAADISASNMDGLYDLCTQNFLAVGDGRNKGFVHVDMRPDKIRRWRY